MRHQELHVARVLVLLRRLEALDLGQHRLVHRRHQHLRRVLVVGGDARHHVGDDEPLQVLLVLERVLHGQDPAPGVAEQVEVVLAEPERLADLLDLLDEARRSPQRSGRPAGRCRRSRAGRSSSTRCRRPERSCRRPRSTRGSRPARRAAAGRCIVRVVADALGPDAEGALRRAHRDQLAPRRSTTSARLRGGAARRPSGAPQRVSTAISRHERLLAERSDDTTDPVSPTARPVVDAGARGQQQHDGQAPSR